MKKNRKALRSGDDFVGWGELNKDELRNKYINEKVQHKPGKGTWIWGEIQSLSDFH